MTKLVSISESVQERLDEMRAPQDLSYNEVILTLMEKPSMTQVWNRHMAVIGLMIHAFGKKTVEGELDDETIQLANQLKEVTKKAREMGVIG